MPHDNADLDGSKKLLVLGLHAFVTLRRRITLASVHISHGWRMDGNLGRCVDYNTYATTGSSSRLCMQRHASLSSDAVWWRGACPSSRVKTLDILGYQRRHMRGASWAVRESSTLISLHTRK